MRHADLVVAFGTGLQILANYFDPWDPKSKWAKPAPKGKRRRVDDDDPPPPCRLAIVTKGKATDQALASVKIDADCDTVMARLREKLGYAAPPPPYDVASDPLLKIAVQPFEGEHAAPWRIPRVNL